MATCYKEFFIKVNFTVNLQELWQTTNYGYTNFNSPA